MDFESHFNDAGWKNGIAYSGSCFLNNVELEPECGVSVTTNNGTSVNGHQLPRPTESVSEVQIRVVGRIFWNGMVTRQHRMREQYKLFRISFTYGVYHKSSTIYIFLKIIDKITS